MAPYTGKEKRQDDPHMLILNEIRKEQKDIKKQLFGNGSVGFCEEIRNNKKDIKWIKDRISELFNDRKKIVGSFILMMGTIILGLVLR